MPTRPVIDQFLAHIPAGAFDQSRQKPMHGGEVWQLPKRLGPDQFPAAACICRIVAQHEPANAIGDTRLQPLEATIISAVSLARDNSELTRLLIGD